MTDKVVAIIQARMGSTRLPGKTLMDLAGEPVVDHVIRRARRAKRIDDVMLAIPALPDDDILAEHLDILGQRYIRGDAEDVLARYQQAAMASEADVIVRITADCPLIDPRVIDRVIKAYMERPAVDYCSNTLRRTYPIGMDTEVFSREALERAFDEATEPYEREHVTPYIYQHPKKFRLRNVEAPEESRRPEYRLTVDEQVDLEVIRELASRLGAHAGLECYVRELDSDPVLLERNLGVAHRYVSKPKL
ncbi:MAG: glycosyltransferase family protein [Coriobacteriia bacterium]